MINESEKDMVIDSTAIVIFDDFVIEGLHLIWTDLTALITIESAGHLTCHTSFIFGQSSFGSYFSELLSEVTYKK